MSEPSVSRRDLENAPTIREGIDLRPVHTGIQDDHHLVAGRVEERRARLDS